MTGQTANKSTQTPADAGSQVEPADLALWNYEFSYDYRQSAQDSITATLEFNLERAFAAAALTGDALFPALAQFVSVYPAIADDFAAFLTRVDGNSSKDDQQVVDARFALDAFEHITAGVASAYTAWSNPAVFAGPLGTLARVTLKFLNVLSDDKGDARQDIYKISQSPEDVTLPPPVVYINRSDYIPFPV